MAPWRAAKGVMRDAAIPLSTPLTVSCLLPSLPPPILHPKASSSPWPSLAWLCLWVTGWLPWKEEALSEIMLMTLISGTFPLPSPQGCTGHGGEEGDGNAMFQTRCNHAISAGCGQKRVTESNDMALTPHFLFSKCCGSFHSPAPPRPPSRANIVITLLKLWETEARRSQDAAIQHLRHRSHLGPRLSSPQSKWKSTLFKGDIPLPWPGSGSIRDALGLFQMFSYLAARNIRTSAGPACPYSSAGCYIVAAAFHPRQE